MGSLRTLLLVPIVFLLPLVARAGGPCSDPLVDGHWEPASYNHVLVLAEGTFEVLVPEPGLEGESFRVVPAATLAEAHRLAQAIDEPLDLARYIGSRRPHLEELLALLGDFKGADESIQLTARTKEIESLKRKVFDKARKKGAGFRLSDIDDVLGARLAVPDLAAVESTAARLRSLAGLDVLKFDRIRYERGYRAIHLTVRAPAGHIFEIQVMTRRMAAWVAWNARRVYKPTFSTSSPYYARLKAYDAELVSYLNALDEQADPLPPRPDPARNHILAQDEFPASELN